MANEQITQLYSNADSATNGGNYGYANGLYVVGKKDGYKRNGMFRFRNIAIPQGTTVFKAELYMYINHKGTPGNSSDRLRFKTWGCDVDDLGDFSTDRFSTTKTSASDTSESEYPSGNFKQVTVTSIVNEILARGGWSSGNTLGFICEDNGSNDNMWINGDNVDSFLSIIVTEANLKPTPVTVSAPTFPAAGDWGLRISKPGIDVKTATDSQLLFTSKRKVLKVKSEGEAICVAGTLKQIAHNLGYPTPVLVFIQGTDGKRFKLNRILYGATDPVTNGKQGICGSSNNNLEIYADGTAYYYILIDPLVE